jgi:hypothetical protein
MPSIHFALYITLVLPDVEARLADPEFFGSLRDAPPLFSECYGFPFELFCVDFALYHAVPFLSW